MVSLPWAFQTSGILLGLIISFTSFVISYYTCALIIKTTKNDTDYVFTLRKYYGKLGFYIGLIGPTILIFGAITVYFVVIVQSLYPLFYVIGTKLIHISMPYIDPNTPPYCHLDSFSASWIALLMYVLLVSASMKKDLTVFIRLSSIGVICVICLILFVIGFGVYSIVVTDYEFKLDPAKDEGYHPDISTVLLFNSQFSNLAGCLCAGYFIHQVSIPIISNAADPSKNLRNVFLGYLLVFLCYITVGSLGYFAFTGKYFESKRDKDTGQIPIEDNFLNMFEYDQTPAIIMRTMISIQLCCSYPLVNHFQRMILVNLFWKDIPTVHELSKTRFYSLNIGISLIPLIFALFYPKIGAILSYAASISGFFMIYVIPVMAYMKMKKLEITHPLLADALQQNEV